MHHRRFDYMHYARENAVRPGLPLSASGSAAQDLSAFWKRIDPSGLAIEEHPGPELKRLIAARYGVSADQVVHAVGTSQANLLVAQAFLRPGDEVVVERPAYEALPGVAEWLGATLVRLDRPEGALDFAALERALTPKTRLVMLTHPHNPSGRALTRDELVRLGRLASERRIPMLVDEVYRDDLPNPPPVAAALSPWLLTTSSLTKVYGLGSLRVGWILCSPEWARQLTDLNDWGHVNAPTPSLMLAHAAWPELDAWRENTRKQIAESRQMLEGWRSRTGLLPGRIEDGVPFYLAKLPEADDRAFCARLEAAGVVLPAGSHYEAPGMARVGYGRLAPEKLKEALAIVERVSGSQARPLS